jgi:GntR family transcriptional regulator
MEELGVSRQTVREALRSLEAEGLVVRRQGVGSLIAHPPPIEAGIETLESNMESIRRAGYVPGSVLLAIDKVNLPPSVAAGLTDYDARSAGGYSTKTIFTADEKPVIYSVSYVRESRINSAEQMELRRGLSSMREFFTLVLNTRVHYARVIITAERADPDAAQQLGLHPGDPILILEGTTFSTQNEPLYFIRASVRTDQYRFTLVRR